MFVSGPGGVAMPRIVSLVVAGTALFVLPALAFALAGVSAADVQREGEPPSVIAPSPEEARAHVVSFWREDRLLPVSPKAGGPPEDCRVTSPHGGDPVEQRACVEALLASSASAGDHRFFEALLWARVKGDDDFVWRIHKRYQPIARCSRDPLPLIYLAETAEFCSRTGRTSCAVQLYTQVFFMASASSLVLTSRWPGSRPGSLKAKSPFEVLADHVDIQRFLPGLIARRVGVPDGAPLVAPEIVARGIVLTNARSTVMPTLEAWIADSSVAVEIRQRALYAWATTQSFEGAESDEIRRAALSLPGVDREMMDETRRAALSRPGVDRSLLAAVFGE